MSVTRTSNKSSWHYDFWHLGKRYRKRFNSREKALKAEAQKRLEIGNGSVSDEHITFRNVAKLFFENHSKPSKNVWKEDASKIKYFNSLFGDKKLVDFTPFDIQSMRNNLQEKGLSNATIDKYHALIKTIFNKAISWRYFARGNPANEVKLKREPNAHIRCLTEDDLKLLNPNIQNDIVYPYYLVALHTGMRRNEIRNMKFGDLDLDSRNIHLPTSKSNKARDIPMDDTMYNLFAKLCAGKDRESKVLIQLSPAYISHRFVKICKKIGIKDFRFHDLRHTFATVLIKENTNTHAVKKWLGHSSIVTTEKNYINLLPDFQKESIRKLDKLSSY